MHPILVTLVQGTHAADIISRGSDVIMSIDFSPVAVMTTEGLRKVSTDGKVGHEGGHAEQSNRGDFPPENITDSQTGFPKTKNKAIGVQNKISTQRNEPTRTEY